ncbi:MAG: S8/S53 family peptidase [Deltaproteobacteria bacterium]|nr:S8/S53 family peptidase [Deltaproteobacteria bacterium]
MSMYVQRRWIAAIGFVAAIAPTIAAAQSLQRVGSAPPFARRSESLDVDPATTIDMTLQLHGRDEGGLDRLLLAQSTPSSSEYRHWLEPQEFAARFGANDQTYEAVVDWLRTAGFSARPWRNRLRVDFRGSVEQAARVFQVTMRRYRHGARQVIANQEPPAVPQGIADAVATVRLHNAPLAQPLIRINTTGGSTTLLAPNDVFAAYHLRPLLDAGFDGSGQSVAVVARSDFSESDMALFRQRFGVAAGAPVKVFPGSNPGIGAPNGVCRSLSGSQRQTCIQQEKIEALIDVEWSGGVAPGASVLVDISDTDIDVSLADIVNHHPEAKQISISFGTCERLDGGESLRLFAPLFSQAAAQGQTIFIASGDNGADDCGDGRGASVNALGTDPNVTSVGGTILDPGFDAAGNASAWVSERTWNDRSGAGGGGASKVVSKPSYQQAPGVPQDGSRDQPDVALAASAYSPGYVAIVDGASFAIGGTSVATPIWSGFAALLAERSAPLGFGVFNSVLYGVGRKQYAFGVASAFHDVVQGNISANGVVGPAATTGYDLATGLGTPDIAALSELLAACPGDCNDDQQVTVDEIITGVNITLGETPLASCAVLDTNADGVVTVDELVAATGHALLGCLTAMQN